MDTPNEAVPGDRFHDEPDVEQEGPIGNSGETSPLQSVGGQAGQSGRQNGVNGSQQQSQRRPGSQERQNSQQRSQRQMNPDFQDVEETGKWGTISRKEILIVSCVGILVIVGVVLGVVLTRDDSNDSSSQNVQEAPPPSPLATPPPTPSPIAPTAAPSPSPTWDRADPQPSLDYLINLINGTNIAEEQKTQLPTDAADLVGQYTNASAPNLVRAADWLLNVDEALLTPDRDEDWFQQRYSLTILYFSLNGASWKRSDNWLGGKEPSSGCKWHGVECDFKDNFVTDIDLKDNNLQGNIPYEISLLPKLISLRLSYNKITGKLPTQAFIDSKELALLYLESNEITGEINRNILKNGVLETLYLQRNKLTGRVPPTVCTAKSGGDFAFGIDCNEVTCQCCSQDGDECYLD